MLDAHIARWELQEEGSDLLNLLTPKQQAVELDPHFLRVLCGGRQWGKSTWTAVAHARAAVPGEVSLALAPTVTKARDLLFPGVEWLNEHAGLGAELIRGDYQVRWKGGGITQCLGLGSEREAEKVRGYHPPFITVEECGVYPDALLEFTIVACAQPAQSKWHGHAQGRGIALIGTPGRVMGSYWHQQCEGKLGGSVHRATIHDNPWIGDPEGYISTILLQNASRGWTRNTPTVRREYYGEWVPETDSMPYAGWDGRIHPASLVPFDGLTILSLDFGYQHPNAWVVGRIATITVPEPSGDERVTGYRIHLLHAEQQGGLTTDAVAERTRVLAREHRASIITGDPFGTGRQSIEDLARIYNIPIEAEKKQAHKQDRIWTGASLLQSGAVWLHDGAESLGGQLRTVPWNEGRTDHDERYPDHMIDAFLGVVGYAQAWQTRQAPVTAGLSQRMVAQHRAGVPLAELRAKAAAQAAARRVTREDEW